MPATQSNLRGIRYLRETNTQCPHLSKSRITRVDRRINRVTLLPDRTYIPLFSSMDGDVTFRMVNLNEEYPNAPEGTILVLLTPKRKNPIFIYVRGFTKMETKGGYYYRQYYVQVGSRISWRSPEELQKLLCTHAGMYRAGLGWRLQRHARMALSMTTFIDEHTGVIHAQDFHKLDFHKLPLGHQIEEDTNDDAST
jgi:hypothetical protein